MFDAELLVKFLKVSEVLGRLTISLQSDSCKGHFGTYRSIYIALTGSIGRSSTRWPKHIVFATVSLFGK